MIDYELGKFMNARGHCIAMGQSSFLVEVKYIWKSRECPICRYCVHFWSRFLWILRAGFSRLINVIGYLVLATPNAMLMRLSISKHVILSRFLNCCERLHLVPQSSFLVCSCISQLTHFPRDRALSQ